MKVATEYLGFNTKLPQCRDNTRCILGSPSLVNPTLLCA